MGDFDVYSVLRNSRWENGDPGANAEMEQQRSEALDSVREADAFFVVVLKKADQSDDVMSAEVTVYLANNKDIPVVAVCAAASYSAEKLKRDLAEWEAEEAEEEEEE